MLPIPWKDNILIPNNFFVANVRLRSLRTSLVRKGILDRYHSEIVKLLESGYAEEVPDAASSEKVWYLPHHPMISDKKT